MKKVLLVGAFLLSPLFSVRATYGVESETRYQDTITLSSGYFEGQYSNDQLAVFGLELLRLGSNLEEKAISTINPDNNLYVKIPSLILNLFVHHAFTVAYHETGHGLGAKAYGSDYQLLSKLHDRSNFKKDENFFRFFAKKLFHVSRSGCRFGGLPENESGTLEKITTVASGGMNNEMYVAEKLGDELYQKGNLKSHESIAYFLDRLRPAFYARSSKITGSESDANSGDDPVAINAYWKNMGVRASKNDIESAGFISLFLSGTTWSIFREMYRCFSSGNKYNAEPLTICGFRVPDTYSYIYDKGVSYKFVSAYDVSRYGFSAIFGYERIFHGHSGQEFTLGIEQKFKWLDGISLKVVTTSGEGFNVACSCSVPVKRFIINFGVNSYDNKSLSAKRFSRNMKDNVKRGNSAFISLSYRY